MNKNEIWMPIKNYENYYVSNLGNVMVIKNVAKKLKKKVDCLDMNGNLVKTYESVSATRKDDFLPNKVCQVCKNKYGRKTHKGYLWKYHSSEETSY